MVVPPVPASANKDFGFMEVSEVFFREVVFFVVLMQVYTETAPTKERRTGGYTRHATTTAPARATHRRKLPLEIAPRRRNSVKELGVFSTNRAGVL